MATDSAASAGTSGVFPAGDPFFGGGEAGAILRGIDWSKKSIGTVASWPQSLRTALSICLASRHPVCIIWGPERICFYNDACTPLLGSKHPTALGESCITVWPEIWESSMRPILETVEQTGQSSGCDDLLFVLKRNGCNEECYFSFSFAAARSEDGSVGGVFTAITETTARVVDERRLRTMRDLGTRVPAAKTAQDMAAQLSASEARFELLVAMMPAGLLACDAAGRITFFNRRAAEIWHARPAPLESYESFVARFRMISASGSPVAAAERHVGRALKEGISFENKEALMERPDGTRFVAHFDVSPTFDPNGVVTGAILVFQDVTEERSAQVALQQTQERYRAVFQQAAVGIFECDLRGKVVRSNPALSRIIGFSAEELRAKNWRELTHPDELATENELVSRLLRSEIGSITAELRFLRKDGSFGWLDVFATLIRDESGAPSYGLGVVVDISERKRAEAEVRETEDRFREAADNAPVLIWIAGSDKLATWFNRPWLEFVGRSLEEEYGEGWMRDIHPEDHRRCMEIFDSAFDRRESLSLEYRLRRHDGEYRWLLDHGVPRYQDGEFAGYIGSCIDITDRRAAEEAMNESRNAERARRQELEVLTQIAPAGIWMAHDPECREITGNAAAHAMLRIPAGRNLSRSGLSDANPPTVSILQNGQPIPTENLAMRVAARTGRTLMNQELEFRFPDGTSTWVYGSATPLMDENGKVRGVVCVMVDITERKRIEAELRVSEKQLRLITDHTAVLLAQLGRDHRYRFVNRTYSERYGRPVEEFIGLHVSEVIGHTAYETAKPHIERSLAGESSQFEVYYPDKGRWGHVVYEPERAGNDMIVGLVAVVIDITLRKHAEIELQRARDEALAASRAKDDFLAALSHELRTPLSPVLLLASEAAADAKLPARVRKDFATIRKCVELEARLIDDLLDLTRITRGKLVLGQVKLNLLLVVKDALATVEADLREKQIDVVVEIGESPAWVWGDPVRLQQVFWNILKNAVKFTPAKGRVTITSGTRADGKTWVEIKDTGIGITPGELERVFEAFSQGDHAFAGGSHRFGGLGLGLAISRRVVELHDGRISAESAGRDHGATFLVELPLFKATTGKSKTSNGLNVSTGLNANCTPDDGVMIQANPTAAVRRVAVTKEGEPGMIGRILLVEDHAPTRTALEHLLIRRNYEVRSAASAADARMLARQESFALLISDIGLPDGSGYDLMREFREEYGMIGISLTGYGMEEDVSRSQHAGFIQHLTKPVRMQSLDDVLARISPPIKVK
jgi:PAS domain S-box-containing protein